MEGTSHQFQQQKAAGPFSFAQPPATPLPLVWTGTS